MKIDLKALDFDHARGGRHLVAIIFAEDGDKIRAEKILMETAYLLREGKEIPEITRHAIAKQLERIAESKPLSFFNYKATNRSENRSQKVETFFQVEELMETGKANSVLKAAEILSETVYKTRSPEAITKDYYRGKKLAREIQDNLMSKWNAV